MTTARANELQWIFIENHYDVHLEGTCIYQGMFCRFKMHGDFDDGNLIYEVTPLNWYGRILARAEQYLFEVCVGLHWTYKRDKRRLCDGERWAWCPELVKRLMFAAYYWCRGFGWRLPRNPKPEGK